MARRLRYLFHENALVEVTTRTIHGRYLLRPSKEFNAIYVGVLGRALEKNDGVLLHAVTAQSNHDHKLLTVPDARALARFMCYFNSNLAREIARMHDWRDKVWSRRYVSIVKSQTFLPDDPSSGYRAEARVLAPP